MFDSLIDILTGKISSVSGDRSENSEKYDRQEKLEIATAAIFIEMAKADGKFSNEEREQVVKVLQEQFNLEKTCVAELLELSSAELKNSVSLYEFSNILNENFTVDDKFELLKNLWRLIYSDKKLDKYEDHLIKVIGGMLNMEHRQIIDAKMIIREELKLD
jgi:uncharacterized tellurite resistance protein B-like protein